MENTYNAFQLKRAFYLFQTFPNSPKLHNSKDAGNGFFQTPCNVQLQDSKCDPTACAPGITKMLEEHTMGTPDICVLLWLATESDRKKKKKKLSLKKGNKFSLHTNVSCHQVPLHCVYPTGKSCQSFINNPCLHYSVTAH